MMSYPEGVIQRVNRSHNCESKNEPFLSGSSDLDTTLFSVISNEVRNPSFGRQDPSHSFGVTSRE